MPRKKQFDEKTKVISVRVPKSTANKYKKAIKSLVKKIYAEEKGETKIVTPKGWIKIPMKCPNCEAYYMIQDTRKLMPTDPPQYYVKCLLCNYKGYSQ